MSINPDRIRAVVAARRAARWYDRNEPRILGWSLAFCAVTVILLMVWPR